jgi:hypothetical protein
MTVHVSVTGLRVKSWWQMPVFFWHAIPSFRQAQRAPGVLFAEVCNRKGVQHTLTVWKDREAMRDFMTSGAHLKAMRAFRSFATGRIHGYEADAVPSWDEAIEQWRIHGREY